MKNLTDEWEVLDLTDAESKVLWALIEYGTLSVSATSRKAKVARTTVDAALRRLQERKLTRRVNYKGQKEAHKGHSVFWKAVRPERVKRELLEAAEPFDKDTISARPEEIVGGVDSRFIGIIVFHGKQQVMQAYEQVLALSKAERIVAIQGNISAEEALKSLDRDYIFSFHKKLKDSGVIIEGLSGEYVKSLFRRLDLDELQSHLGRLIVSWLLPDEYMDFGIDLLVMRDTVIFIDIKAEIVVVIRHKGIVELCNALARLAQEYGKKFDMNAFISKLIEEKRKI